jgi:hypothetical protein
MFREPKEVTDAQGNPPDGDRSPHRISDSGTEILLNDLTSKKDTSGFGQDKTTKQQRAVGFVMATFQKIMSSSPRAIKQALRRRLIALYARKQMALESGFHGGLTKAEVSSKIVQYQEVMRSVVADLLSFTGVG